MPNSIQIPYTEVRDALGEVTLRPIVVADFFYQDRGVRASALVDSGADVSVLPFGLGLSLGLVWEEQHYSLYLSGNLANYDARAVVLALRVADFAPVDLAFAWTQAEQAPLIFGQTNFFQVFNVCFYLSEIYFTLTAKNTA